MAELILGGMPLKGYLKAWRGQINLRRDGIEGIFGKRGIAELNFEGMTLKGYLQAWRCRINIRRDEIDGIL